MQAVRQLITIGESAFRVMSYNILAPSFAIADRYPYSGENLDWDVRKSRLVSEISGHQPDIVCLQECERKVYTSYLQPEFAKLGFEGVTGTHKGGAGFGIFFRQKTFSLLSGPDRCKLEDVDAPREFGIVLTLLLRAHRRVVIVASVHLDGHPLLSDLRARQASHACDMLMQARDSAVSLLSEGWVPAPAEKVALKRAPKHTAASRKTERQTDDAAAAADSDHSDSPLPDAPPVLVLCGDFNDRPASAAYVVAESHPLQLHSAYRSVQGREPVATFSTDAVQATVDYVFVGGGGAAAGVLAVECERVPPCPNAQHASDHLPLCVDVALRT